jgi:hypothetical protein
MNTSKFAFLLPLLLFAHASVAQTTDVEVREDIRTFAASPAKVNNLRKAVAALQSRRNDNATAWLNMANIHKFPSPLPSDIPDAVKALFAQCHKREDMFFLWHRAYVWSLERLLQDAIGDSKFRLPYWDWYRDPAIPEIFRSEWLDTQHTQKNPLYVKNRNPNANAGRAVWTPQIFTNFNEARFTAFQDQLNYNEHGTIHGAVGTGTNMGSQLTAARDPLFWLHHANIDRLLPVWKKMGAQHVANTTYPLWQKETYRFPVPGWTLQNPVTVTPSIDDLALNATDGMMGYKYEDTSPPSLTEPEVPLRPAAAKSGPAEAAEEGQMLNKMFNPLSIHKDIEIGPGGTVTLPMSSPGREKLMQLAAPKDTATPAPGGLAIVLSGVKLTKKDDNVLSFAVYVDLPEKKDATTRFHDHFIGSISLFALSHAEGEHDDMGPEELRFEATNALAAMVRSAKGTAPETVNVSIIPVMAPDTKPPTETVLKISQVRIEAAATPQ